MLNFDMIASPNSVPFVYDGDGSASDPAGPNGSSVVEDVFLKYFATFYKAGRSRRPSTDVPTTVRSSPSAFRRVACSPAPRV